MAGAVTVQPKQLRAAVMCVLVVFVLGCFAFLYNYDKREPEEPVPKAVPTSTVTVTATPVPTATRTVTVQTEAPNVAACREAGKVAAQVRELTGKYTEAVGRVPEALGEAQKGVAMKDLRKLNRAQELLNDADNASTESLQQLVLLDKRLAGLNAQCAG